MSTLAPGTTLMGKYRIERLVAGNDAVALWEATELGNGRVVQLSVYANGSTMLDIAQIDSGMLVVVDARSNAAPPRLELVDVTSDEDAFFDEPPPPELFDDVPMAGPKRLWPWALAAIASFGIGAGAWYVARGRAVTAGEATITEAVIPAHPIEAKPPVTPTPTAAEPRVAEPKKPSPATPLPSPAPKRPQPLRRAVPARRAVPHATPTAPPSDPLTL